MAARSTLAAIITRVRNLVGDTGSTAVLTDDQYQDFLDESRSDVFNLVLTPQLTIVTNGKTEYLDYFSPGVTDWEDDLVLRDNAFNVLTPSVTDNHVGHWQFPLNQTSANIGQIPAVFLTGKTFDVYGAAVLSLQAWMGLRKEEFTFGMGRGDIYQRSDKIKQIKELIDQYKGKQRIGQIQTYRSDMQSVSNWGWR